jgi:hypothetical protein
VRQLCSTALHESERCFLKHVDDNDLMVHQNLNIIRVIDWQIARTAPANEAFCPSLLTAVMNSICNGNFGYSSKDRLLANVLWKREQLNLRRSCLPLRRQDASRGLLRLNRIARMQRLVGGKQVRAEWSRLGNREDYAFPCGEISVGCGLVV